MSKANDQQNVKAALNETVIVLRQLSNDFEEAVNYYGTVSETCTAEQQQKINEKFGQAVASYLLFDEALKMCQERMIQLDNKN
jgi:hypothetical protein